MRLMKSKKHSTDLDCIKEGLGWLTRRWRHSKIVYKFITSREHWLKKTSTEIQLNCSYHDDNMYFRGSKSYFIRRIWRIRFYRYSFVAYTVEWPELIVLLFVVIIIIFIITVRGQKCRIYCPLFRSVSFVPAVRHTADIYLV